MAGGVRSFYLHSVNFGLPWSSCTASSSSCSSENDVEAPSLLTYSRGQSFSCGGVILPRRGTPCHRQGVEQTGPSIVDGRYNRRSHHTVESLPGLDFYLHSVNLGLPWSSCTASSSSCSSENDGESPSLF